MAAQADIGTAEDRVDGLKKVTGQACYAGEHRVQDLLYGVIVSAGIARGRITSIDTSTARKVEGVVEVITHQNRPHVPWYDMSDGGLAANTKPPFRIL